MLCCVDPIKNSPSCWRETRLIVLCSSCPAFLSRRERGGAVGGAARGIPASWGWSGTGTWSVSQHNRVKERLGKKLQSLIRCAIVFWHYQLCFSQVLITMFIFQSLIQKKMASTDKSLLMVTCCTPVDLRCLLCLFPFHSFFVIDLSPFFEFLCEYHILHIQFVCWFPFVRGLADEKLDVM